MAGCDSAPSATVAGPSAQLSRAATPAAAQAAVQASALANFEAAHGALSGRGITRDDGSALWDNLGQSPIDIPVNNTVKLLSLDPVIGWTPFVPDPDEENEEEVKVNTGDVGGTLTIRGQSYTFKQFHFHRSSEHTINGKRSAMEVHFVHIAGTAIAVVGVLMDVGPANAALEAIWPSAVTSAIPAPKFDARKLLPALNAPYFTYSGSLTTPRGDVNNVDGLTWIVYKQPIRLSAAQLQRYATAFPEENSRDVQPLAGRTVFERVGGGR